MSANLEPAEIVFHRFSRRIQAACGASACMTDQPSFPLVQQRAQQRFQAALGRRLSRQYEAIEAEPVPEAFLQLLQLADRMPNMCEPKI